MEVLASSLLSGQHFIVGKGWHKFKFYITRKKDMKNNICILLCLLLLISLCCEHGVTEAYLLSGGRGRLWAESRSPSGTTSAQTWSSRLFQATSDLPSTTSPTSSDRIEVPVRNDNFIERWLIKQLAFLVARNTEEPVLATLPLLQKQGKVTYQDFVIATKIILHSTSDPKRITAVILNLLKSLLPLSVRDFMKASIQKNSKFVSEMSAWWINCGFLHWLIGPVRRMKVVIPPSGEEGSEQVWNSGIKMQHCRYLKEANCKSACSFLCKAPTEQLFNQELGLAMYMKPNFEEQSCEMFFGLPPPAPDDDPAFKEACYGDCATVKAGLPIPRWKPGKSDGNDIALLDMAKVEEGEEEQ